MKDDQSAHKARMKACASCSCRLGPVVRGLGLGARPLPHKRGWQFAGSLLLFFFAFAFYYSITRNIDQHGPVALAVIGFFGIAIFLAALLGAIVALIGCDDCVSRM